MPLGLTTELEAVNRMLRVIGESPASSLSSLPDDGIEARAALADVTRQVLVEGWHFNTDDEFPLTASATVPYDIKVPRTAAKVDLSPSNARDMVIRGGRLYDRKKHTFSFPGVTVKATIVWLFPFDELPETLRQYVTIRAARQFAAGSLQSQLIEELTADDELRARVLWESDDTQQADANILTGNPTTAAILDRSAGY